MAHRLNRELTLEMPARVPDGAGGFRESWMPLGVLWAKVTARTGRETAGAAGPLSQVAFRIIVRAAPTCSNSRPQPNQRFRDGSRYYRILSVAEDDVDGRYLLCNAQEETVA